jgi:DNA-binding response OmpR family regulator
MLSMLRRKGRLLLLDDDPSMQRLISALLSKEGYRVDVVSEASQATAHIARKRYDALLLDVMTPTEGGLTVIRSLRESQPALLARVLLVTASPDSLLRSVATDIAGVVRKPFQAAELIEAVRRVVKK